MKTNDELETLIQNLIERVNRIEAASADVKAPVPADVAKPTIDFAIEILDRAVALYGQQSAEYQAMVMDIRRSTGKLVDAR